VSFIQIIEFSTTRINEVEALLDEWITKTKGQRAADRATLTVNRDEANSYLQIVEFPSFDAAMRNSNLPDTGLFAQRLAELCAKPLVFRNLDVRRVDDLE
jgi:hypothetical protein